MLPQNFVNQMLDALIQVFIAIAKVILLPFTLWVKSICHLAEQKDKGVLDLNKITGPWPFLTFCKRLIIDVSLDVTSFLSFPIGVIVAVVMFLVALIDGDGIIEAISYFILVLLLTYCVPVYTALLNNMLKLMMLPIRKCIDWLKKPAQHMEINTVQEVNVKKEE